MKLITIIPQFVELIPREIQDGVLYISEKYGTASHNCCCGCGMKVVTPLSPARWQLRREGDLVTLIPSIGNWNFPCRSHYWIKRNRVEWAGSMSSQEIRRVKQRDKLDLERYIENRNASKMMVENSGCMKKSNEAKHPNLWRVLKKWLQELL